MTISRQSCLFCHLISLLVILIVDVNAETKTYKVEDSCASNGMSFSVDKGDEYELTYNGDSYLPQNECEYKFWPSNNESILCIKADSFFLNDCNILIDYYGGRVTSAHYNCRSSPAGEYCDSYGGATLTIKFRNGDSNKDAAADISLKVAMEEDFDWIVLAIVLGSLAGFGLAVFLTVCLCHRCKKPRGERVSPEPPSLSNSTVQTRQQQRPPVQTQSTSTHEMSTQINLPTPSAEPTYEEDGIHKPRTMTSTEHGHSSNQPPPEPSAPPLVPNAPSYDNEPPPSYEQAMGKTMDV